MTRVLALAALVAAGCTSTEDDHDYTPIHDPSPTAPSACNRGSIFGLQQVGVTGRVVDFATGAAVADASVDITTAWDVINDFPAAGCPMIATVRTGADGRFGPITISPGSSRFPPILLFMVRGAGRAPTASDVRSCPEEVCRLDHEIAAPAATLADAWRADLAAGGMPDAATRGLVALHYTNRDASPAAGVVPTVFRRGLDPLVPAREVRFVAADRSALAPATVTATTASGVALVAVATDRAGIELAGSRAGEGWDAVGCLAQRPWLFVETVRLR